MTTRLDGLPWCSTPKGIKGWDSLCGEPNGFTVAILCSTPYGIKGWDSKFRGYSDAHLALCSTPKGIKGWDSVSYLRKLATKPVLNAKRHQRLGQVGYLWPAGYATRCSTPKGIKGWDSREIAEDYRDLLGAQRQKASKVGTVIT